MINYNYQKSKKIYLEKQSSWKYFFKERHRLVKGVRNALVNMGLE